jgi:hypothetical protein
MTQTQTHTGLLRIEPPLVPTADMPSIWRDVDLDFDTAAQKLVLAHTNDGEPRDLPVLDLRTWGVKADDGRFALRPLGGHHAPRQLRRNAFANLCARLGAPGEFIRDALPAPLQVAVLNYLLASQERPMSAMLRLRGSEVSAIVSGRYAALDPNEIVDALREAFVENDLLDRVRVRGLATGLVDALRFVLPNEQQEIKVGDVTAVGFDVSTSNFGRSALRVCGTAYRLFCDNGVRVPHKMGEISMRHVGDPLRLKDGLAEAIPTALVHARGVMDQWRSAVGVFIDDVGAAIDQMRELTIVERRTVEEELVKEIGVRELPERTSLFDFTNALTATAKHAEPARRLEIESLAGQVLATRAGSS